MTHNDMTSRLAIRLRRLARRFGVAGLGVTLLLAWAHPAAAACPSCGTSPCTMSGTHTIASGDTCNYAGKDVILTGTFQGDNNAACYTVVADNLTLRGTLRARSSCINLQVSGNFKMEVVSNSAATVDVRNADSFGDGLFVDCASATLNGNAINADADDWDATIRIGCTGDITGSGGPFHAVGSGGTDGGSIEITSSEGKIDLASAFDVSGGGEYSYGGSIMFDAADDVTVGTSSRSLQAQGTQGGSGGSADITAGGTATIDGTINLNGSGEDADGGDISVSASVVSTGTTWNARGDTGGTGGSIDVWALDGEGTVTTSNTAAWNVNGSGGSFGGSVSVDALGNVSLNGDMDATGTGTDTWGGDVWINTNGNITVANTSRIDADATGGDAADGSVILSACNITIAGSIDTRRVDLFGHNDFTYAGTFTQSSGSALLADDGDGSLYGNNLYCRCVDTTPVDGVCDSPAACVSNPTLNGTVNPSATIVPTSMESCG